MGKQKPKFDPTQPYQEVEGDVVVDKKPKFDPNKPFTAVVEKKSADGSEGVISKDLLQPANVQEPLSGGLGTNDIKVTKPLPTGLLIEDADPEAPEKVASPILDPKTRQDQFDYIKQAKIKDSLKTPVIPGDNLVIDLGLNPNDKAAMNAESAQAEKDQKEIDEAERIRKEKLISNPFVSFYESAKDAIVNQIPGSLAAAYVAMAPDRVQGYAKPGERWETPAEQKVRAKKETAELKESLFKFATEKLDESAKAPLIRSLKDIDDPLDLVNFIMTSVGQSGVQIPLTIATAGTAGAGQEIGGAYMDGINEIAKKNNITPLEVIQQGKDDAVIPVITGIIAGSLDYIGAKGVAKTIDVTALTQSLRKRALTFLGGMSKEALTEGGQSVITKTGTAISTEDNIADMAQKVWDGRMEVVDEMAAGFFGAGGVQMGGAAISKLTQKNKVNESTEEVKPAGEATENIHEQQVSVGEEVVAENKPVEELKSKRAEILAALPIDETTGQPIISEEAQKQLADINNQITSVQNEKTSGIKATEETATPTQEVVVDAAKGEDVALPQDKELITLGIAPYRNKTVESFSEISEEDFGQINLKENIETISGLLGINIRENNNAAGGWFDTDNQKTIKETSRRVHLEVSNPKQAEFMGALLAVLGPEVQQGVYQARYSKEGADMEVEFEFDSTENAEKAVEKLNEFDLGSGFSFDNKTKTLYIGDIGNAKGENILKFIEYAKANGLKRSDGSTATITFPSEGDYSRILQEGRDQGYYGSKNRDSLDNLVIKAQEKLGVKKADTPKVETVINSEGIPASTENQIPQKIIPPAAPVGSTQEKDVPKKERQATKKLLEDENLSQDIKDDVSDFAKFYDPETQEMSNEQASSMIEKLGMDEAKKVSLDMKNDLPPMVRTKLRKQLIFKFDDLAIKAKKKGDKVAYEKHKANAKDLVEARGIRGTELGKELSAYFDPGQQKSASEIIHETEAEVKKQADEKLKEAEPTLENIKKAIEGANKEAIEQILDIPKVRDMIIDKSSTIKGESRKKAVKSAIDYLDSFKLDTKGANDITYLLPATVWNGAISTIQGGLKAGLTIAESVDKAVKYIKSKIGDKEWDEKGFRGNFDEKLKKYEASIDPEKAVKRGIKELETDIRDIVKKHYTEVDKIKKSLVDKLVSEAGLNEADAKEVARNIEKEFDRLSIKTKEQELKKLRTIKDKTVDKKKVDQLHEKIIKQSNLGALSDQELRDIYADKMGLPKLTEEQSKKLEDLAEKVQVAKNGFQKRRAIDDLLKFQDSIKGINWMDVATSIWYANILSGYSTQEINFFANMVETIGEFYTAAVYRPKNIPFMLKGLYEGYGRGILEAWDTIKTGYSPIKSEKVDAINIMERVKFKGGKWNPLNYYKYVKRLMEAADIFAFQGIREMRAYEMAAMEARKQGKENPDQKIWASVTEKLFKTKDRVIEAKAQAKEEGLKGVDYKRRVMELMDQSRPVEMREDMDNFAARGTFNYDPEGTLGFISNQIAGIVENVQYKDFKPLKFVVPFTRIISNVANRYLDWSVVGFYRAGRGQIGTFGSGNYKRKFTPEERAKEYIKATTGTLAMLTILALSDPGDDDEPVFEITAEGTGDIRKNYELGNSGWQKYSIRIGKKWYSYMNTPLAIPMSIVGRIRDDEKYNGKSLEDTDTTTRLGLAVFNNFQFVTDMTFLRGLGDFMGSFSNDNPNAAVAYFEKLTKTTIKGFVVPNLYSQSAKEIQRIYDMPMKEAKGLYEAIIRDIPIANDGLNDMIDAFGDPIVSDTDRLTSDVKTDAAWDIVIKNNAWIGRVMKSSLVVYDPNTEQERGVTDKEYYRFSKIRGSLIKSSILENIEELKEMSKEEVKEEIQEYKKRATKKAKEEIFY